MPRVLEVLQINYLTKTTVTCTHLKRIKRKRSFYSRFRYMSARVKRTLKRIMKPKRAADPIQNQ